MGMRHHNTTINTRNEKRVARISSTGKVACGRLAHKIFLDSTIYLTLINLPEIVQLHILTLEEEEASTQHRKEIFADHSQY